MPSINGDSLVFRYGLYWPDGRVEEFEGKGLAPFGHRLNRGYEKPLEVAHGYYELVSSDSSSLIRASCFIDDIAGEIVNGEKSTGPEVLERAQKLFAAI